MADLEAAPVGHSMHAHRALPPIADCSVAIVAVAVAVGCGFSFVMQTLIGIGASWVFAARGVRIEDLLSAMSEVALLNVVSVAISGAAACLAGALTAWLDARRAYIRALWTGLLLTAFVGIQFLVPYEHMAPLWSKVVALAIPIPAVFVGAWLLLK
jgi:hypothetical protein